MYKLYSMQRSGNSYKVRLALALLNAPYHAIEIDILRGESRTPEFLAKNPSGQVPFLEVGDGRYLAESNAILWYVASGTPPSPESQIERAEALQWMFFEQHALEPNIGAAYFWLCAGQAAATCRPMRWRTGWSGGYGAPGDEKPPQDPPVLRRQPAHGRRHRGLWLYSCRRPLRLRSRHVPRDPGVAQAGRARPRIRFDGLAAGRSRRSREHRGFCLSGPPLVNKNGQNVNLCRDLAVFAAAPAAFLPAILASLVEVAGDSPVHARVHGNDTVSRRSRL
jgi:hypothetical protein